MNSFVEVAQCVCQTCVQAELNRISMCIRHKHNDGHYCDTSFSNFGRLLSNELFDMDENVDKR